MFTCNALPLSILGTALLLLVLTLSPGIQALGMSKRRRLELRDQTKASFYHAYNGYMEHAFPFDELNPITCTGRGSDRQDPSNIGINDVLGDYLLTLVDTLDTLAVLGDKAEFADAVAKTIQYLPDFDIDSYVQVFEVTIRMLGGLLSAHIIATDEEDTLGMRLDQGDAPQYRGELLGLARDLGFRLLPAFEASPCGMPYARTNLKHGYRSSETSKTCTAGAGTLLLEFGTLSRLTNETVFEDLARLALNDLWLARSKSNLFGNTYDIVAQQWISPVAGVGAGIDSIYEYLLKSHVYFGDSRYLQAFETTYSALLRHARDTTGGYAFFNVDMHTTEVSRTWVDSLSAFFPGLMVLAGDVDGAESAYMLFYQQWLRFRAIPERFNLFLREADLTFYPLRPEFIESTYFLYRATRDPFYLDVGEMVLADINAQFRTRCGYASLHNVYTGEPEERMESFLLSETFKYLYLLFDEDNPLHKTHSNYVFTTEAHVLLPLSPVRTSNGTVSAQYPSSASFSKRALIHLENPPRKVNPLLLRVDNIRQKLQSLHPDDMLAFPTPADTEGDGDSDADAGTLPPTMARKCLLPRALSITSVNANSTDYLERFAVEWRTSSRQSPLEQLHAMRELSRATNRITSHHITAHPHPQQQKQQQQQQLQQQQQDVDEKNRDVREYLAALLANNAAHTMPLRADFYNIGILVNNMPDQSAGGAALSANGNAGPTTPRNGTTVVNAALALALEYDGMCSLSKDLHLSERHVEWVHSALEQADSHADAQGLQDPLADQETWITPNTRQISFMELVLARAESRNPLPCVAAARPVARRGVPLLKDALADEIPEIPADMDTDGSCDGVECNSQASNHISVLSPSPLSSPRQFASDKESQLKRRGLSIPGVGGTDEQSHQENYTYQQQVVITNGAAQVMTDHVLVRFRTDASLHDFVRVSPVHNDSLHTTKRTRSYFFSSTKSLVALRSHSSTRNDDDQKADATQIPPSNTTRSDSPEQEQKQQQQLPISDHSLYPHDVYRRRELYGTLASFSELALYRNHGDSQMPGLVPQPTTLVMLHLYSSSAVYGCEEYTPREQKLVKDRVVAVRTGGGCTLREKAVHAMNAGAKAMLVDADTADGNKDTAVPTHQTQPVFSAKQTRLSRQGADDPPLTPEQMLYADGADREIPKQVPMPVVLVDRRAIVEFEDCLAAGLHVRVELL
ncbi:hypothetical protein LPJ53_003919 [Coemansia erecta]|uniref:alpha-1,2-Mannosidase n=1 Tax=Coemansia erecta TaxID=147472 RepID=A0A9W7Y107_9FUNG|nr:hypothetical protein LPJ53_003919 [Coemansia erecta]